MKVRVEIDEDDELLQEAKELTGISDTGEVLEEALRAFIRARESEQRRRRRDEAEKVDQGREEAQVDADRR